MHLEFPRAMGTGAVADCIPSIRVSCECATEGSKGL